MWRSLRVRIFAMTFLVAVIAIGIVVLFTSQGTLLAIDEFALSSQARDQRIIGAALGQTALLTGPTALQQQAAELGAAAGADILLVDEAGRVILDTANQRVGVVMALPPDAVTVPLSDTAAPSAFLIMSYGPMGMVATRSFTQPFDVGLPLPWNMQIRAPSPSELILRDINRWLWLAVAAGGGVAGLLTLALSRRIVGPVETLTIAAREMEKGDLSQRVPIQGRDEIGQLAHAFNAMADGLQRNEQLRRTLVGDIAHELRTPLTNIRGYLEAVKDGIVTPEPAVIESLHEEALLLDRLVGDLQELALAEAGQLRLDRQWTDVAPLIEKAVAALHPQADKRGVALRAEAAPDVPQVFMDVERFGQVLRNLIQNALTHTPEGGEVVAASRAAENGVELTVRDTGAGIAPEHLPYVFERFYRADPSRTRATGGAGLGLAIVKQLVEAHGGRVRIESAPEQGTCVIITLRVSGIAPGVVTSP